ncbi:hypothetical protein [Microvirga zambiensis]|uniref:hypothetical protein n=1 Tax=Microvirga zambiensis TaxID=1402137 RepID=UPI00191CB211|nr:hypothetical protein [Microvirga zambiensis]
MAVPQPTGTKLVTAFTRGVQGPLPEHEVDGARIRFRQQDSTWGDWVEFDQTEEIAAPLVQMATAYANQSTRIIQLITGQI